MDIFNCLDETQYIIINCLLPRTFSKPKFVNEDEFIISRKESLNDLRRKDPLLTISGTTQTLAISFKDIFRQSNLRNQIIIFKLLY